MSASYLQVADLFANAQHSKNIVQ